MTHSEGRSFCVILPCLNEESRIEACLVSILAFDLPVGASLTVAVLDGGSTDRTKQVAESLALKDRRVRIIDNPRHTQAAAVNICVSEVRADYYLWLGSHCRFSNNYLVCCFDALMRSAAQMSGGVCLTLPGGNGYGAQIVQAVTTHRFGVGGSAFRLGGPSRFVDTVAYALIDAKVFKTIGLLDERLRRAQDYEFNCRLRACGGRIMMVPEATAEYFNIATFWAFIRKQMLLEGPYNAFLWFVAPYAFSLRHSVTLFFVAFVAVAGIVWRVPPVPAIAVFVGILYAFLALVASASQSIKFRRPSFILTLPLAFLTFHLAHGLGVWSGVMRIIARAAPTKLGQAMWPGGPTGRNRPRNLEMFGRVD